MWKYANPNPKGRKTGDCAVRALAITEDLPWHEAHDLLHEYAADLGVIENNNAAIAAFLKDRGYTRHVIPDTCPACYTVADFCREHPEGTFVLGTGSHVIAVKSGNWIDSWNSADEIPIYYWEAPK